MKAKSIPLGAHLVTEGRQQKSGPVSIPVDHHGVYIGRVHHNGNYISQGVVHKTGKGEILVEPLKKFKREKTHKLKVVYYRKPILQPEKIVKRAQFAVNDYKRNPEKYAYKIGVDNCEHFVTKCIYDHKMSYQITRASVVRRESEPVVRPKIEIAGEIVGDAAALGASVLLAGGLIVVGGGVIIGVASALSAAGVAASGVIGASGASAVGIAKAAQKLAPKVTKIAVKQAARNPRVSTIFGNAEYMTGNIAGTVETVYFHGVEYLRDNVSDALLVSNMYRPDEYIEDI